MSESIKSIYTWLDYIFLHKYEKELGFRDYIARLSRSGMAVAGILAVVAVLFLIGVETFVLGKNLTWNFQIGNSSAVALGEKIVILFLGVISIVLSRTPRGARWGRLIVFLLILAAGVAVVLRNISKGDIAQSAGILIVVMLIGMVKRLRSLMTRINR